jgi:hydrogenase expression/formation protein HypD
MKHVDEYRDPAAARSLVEKIRSLRGRPVRIMEICGTHTMAVFRHGIRSLLPERVTLISGPGCPVCVTCREDIDRCIETAGIPGTIVATFGDLMRVPGTRSTLAREKARGADVRVVYGSLEAVELARRNPRRKVVFPGIGFETTAPTVAAALLSARNQGLDNFLVLSMHKLLPPAMEALLSRGESGIDGFLCPGHVSTIIGLAPYEILSRKYGVPCVIAGFEPLDLLRALYMLLLRIDARTAGVENCYARAVSPEGNPRALETMDSVFRAEDACWRGLGVVPGGGLGFREPFREANALEVLDIHVEKAPDPPGCACGEVIRGVKTPPECPLFRKTCTPTNPVGPCMVSGEGTCAAYFRYDDAEGETSLD